MTGPERDQAQLEVEAVVLPLPPAPSLGPQLHDPHTSTLPLLQSTESAGTASKHREVARAVPGKQALKLEAVATAQHIDKPQAMQ